MYTYTHHTTQKHTYIKTSQHRTDIHTGNRKRTKLESEPWMPSCENWGSRLQSFMGPVLPVLDQHYKGFRSYSQYNTTDIAYTPQDKHNLGSYHVV